MRETVEAQAEEMEALRRQVAELEAEGKPGGDDAADGGQGQAGEWRPPRRGHGMPDPGVVTLDEQPDEPHAFGAAGGRVAGNQGQDGGRVGGGLG